MSRCLAWVLLVASTVSCWDGNEIASPERKSGAGAADSAVIDWGIIRIATGESCDPSNPIISCDLELVCTPAAVEFGDNVACSIGPEAEVTQWRFLWDGGSLSGPTSGNSWSGPVVVSGTVMVEFLVNGAPGSETAAVNVDRRSSWTWASQVNGAQASPGEIDQCFSPSDLGLASGQSCTGGQYAKALFTPVDVPPVGGSQPYGMQQVSGDGPNGSLWYIVSPTATMQLRSQVRVEFRPDGPAFAMVGDSIIVTACLNSLGAGARSTHTVNTSCLNTSGFADFMSFAWDHEADHVSAGIPAAQQADGDVHLLWEPLARASQSDLQFAARSAFLAAHSHISDAMESTHTGGTTEFEFWRFLSGAWTWAITVVGH